MTPENPLLARLAGWLQQGQDIALTWATSPAAWSQFALLAAAYLLARLIASRVVPRLTRLLTPADDATGPVATARRFALRFLPLLMPLLAYALTAGGEGITRSMFGSGDVIAFG